MGVSIDITDRKETEKSLEKAYEEIKQLKDRLEAENIYLRKSVATKNIYEHIIGQSAPLKKVLSRVEQVGPTDAVVLITGETGTGKELIAEAIHNLSKRKGPITGESELCFAALRPHGKRTVRTGEGGLHRGLG